MEIKRSKTYFYMTYFTHLDVLEPISGNLYTSYAHPVFSLCITTYFRRVKKISWEKRWKATDINSIL